jgi:hypothetical protein
LDGLVFEVLEELERDVQEVAATAGRVEHADGAQAFEEGTEYTLGVLVVGSSGRHLAAGQDQRRDLLLRLRPVAPERLHQDRLHKPQDRSSVGVVSAELGTLLGVEAALEERSEDGGFDLAPVELRYPADRLHLRGRERDHLGVIE